MACVNLKQVMFLLFKYLYHKQVGHKGQCFGFQPTTPPVASLYYPLSVDQLLCGLNLHHIWCLNKTVYIKVVTIVHKQLNWLTTIYSFAMYLHTTFQRTRGITLVYVKNRIIPQYHIQTFCTLMISADSNPSWFTTTTTNPQHPIKPRTKVKVFNYVHLK